MPIELRLQLFWMPFVCVFCIFTLDTRDFYTWYCWLLHFVLFFLPCVFISVWFFNICRLICLFILLVSFRRFAYCLTLFSFIFFFSLMLVLIFVRNVLNLSLISMRVLLFIEYICNCKLLFLKIRRVNYSFCLS